MVEIDSIWNREDHIDLYISTVPIYMCVTLDVICSANLGSSSVSIHRIYFKINQESRSMWYPKLDWIGLDCASVCYVDVC